MVTTTVTKTKQKVSKAAKRHLKTKAKRPKKRKTLSKPKTTKRKTKPVSTPSPPSSSSPDDQDKNKENEDKSKEDPNKDKDDDNKDKNDQTKDKDDADKDKDKTKPKKTHHYKTIIFFLVVIMGVLIYFFVSRGPPLTGAGQYTISSSTEEGSNTRGPTTPASKNHKIAGGISFIICLIITVFSISNLRSLTPEKIREIKDSHEGNEEDIDYKDENSKTDGETKSWFPTPAVDNTKK